MLAEANSASDAQSKPSNSIKAAFGTQTVPASEPSGTLTTGTRAQASSMSKSLMGGTAALPYKSGVDRSARNFLLDSSVRLTYPFLLFLVKCLTG